MGGVGCVGAAQVGRLFQGMHHMNERGQDLVEGSRVSQSEEGGRWHGRKGLWIWGTSGRWTKQHHCKDLLSDERHVGAVLRSLKTTRVGEVKAGSIRRG